MFTGIITAIGTVEGIYRHGEGKQFKIMCPYDVDTIDIGASIAHSGACMTIIEKGKEKDQNWYKIDVSEESLNRTNLGNWEKGTKINLERSLTAKDELGGHIVTGHIDAVARIIERQEQEDQSALFIIEAPEECAPFIAEKGSITLDGTSLTVNNVEHNRFHLTLIPHTLDVTTWGLRQKNDALNLEIDILARYVARQLNFQKTL